LDLLGGLEDYLGFLSKNNLGFLWDWLSWILAD
jgi:hypothetical protein